MTEEEALEQFDEYLDGVDLIDLNLPSTSYVLKEIDPTQYDTMFADYCDIAEIEIDD